MDYEIIVGNGTIFDGSGNDAIRCDIGINKGVITNMGTLSPALSEKYIDAAGLTVCPGFIDAHSHSDVYLLIEPSAASKIYQGITTEICGNCGASAAPLNGNYKMPTDWMAQMEEVAWSVERGEHSGGVLSARSNHTAGIRPASLPAPCSTRSALSWRTVAEYRALFDEIQPAINAALLVGHNTLHAGICGYEARGGTTVEMKQMVATLEQALDEGAIGLSSGLAYPPGSAVPRDELVALATVVARYGGLYTTHMRSESTQLLDAIEEAIDITERSGTRLQISHLKASGKQNWGKVDRAFETIREASERLIIGSDRYPYTAGSTDLDIVLPLWATYGGRDAILGRLRDSATRSRIRDELLEHPPDYWDNVMIGSTQFEELKGNYLPEAAEKLKMNAVDALLHLIDADNLATGGIFFSMSEDNLWKVLAEPYVSIGSDGSMRAPWGPLSSDHPHPRAYGSHTRFLRAALDGRTVPLPEAIRKMTGLPAEQFGLKKRGLLKEGYAADILVFDPDAVRENSTYADPHRLSDGMRHVFVNGVHTLSGGIKNADQGGRFLASGGW